jgi:hypothetical protein
MAILIWFVAGAIWMAATVTLYRACRATNDRSALMDAVCSSIFWPLILPCWSVSTAWKAGQIYGARIVAWNDHRRQPKALRAGSDNGLYD